MKAREILGQMLSVMAFKQFLLIPPVTHHALSEAQRRVIRRKLQAARIAA
jgi:hypothetical protein